MTKDVYYKLALESPSPENESVNDLKAYDFDNDISNNMIKVLNSRYKNWERRFKSGKRQK